MLRSRRAVRACWLVAILLLVAGVGLGLLGTVVALGAGGGLPIVGPVLLAGGIVAASLARELGGSPAGATAIGVIGFMALHLLAVVLALLTAAIALLGGGGWTVPATWALTAAAALGVSYGWDRFSEADVDEALENEAWNPRA